MNPRYGCKGVSSFIDITYVSFNEIHCPYFLITLTKGICEKESHFPTHVSPVNVFRVFFNLYLETDYEILDEKHIWYEPGTPFKQTNVTEIVKSSSFRN